MSQQTNQRHPLNLKEEEYLISEAKAMKK